jgi:Peptidase family M28
MTVTVGNPLLAPLLTASLDQRRQWIASQLSLLGITSIEQPFRTVLNQGCNLFIPPAHPSPAPLLLVAHYDGDIPHDNAGGVWLTLAILQQFWHSHHLAVLFTDREETFQQGATSFIKQYLRTPNPLLTQPTVLCIDGYGAGTQITLRQHTAPFIYLGHYLRMDADPFREAGFNVWTLHSGVECIQPVQLVQTTSADEIGDLSFSDQRLYDLKEDAIARFLEVYDRLV